MANRMGCVCALAGILLVTAAGLIDVKRLRYAMRASRYDAILVRDTRNRSAGDVHQRQPRLGQSRRLADQYTCR